MRLKIISSVFCLGKYEDTASYKLIERSLSAGHVSRKVPSEYYIKKQLSPKFEFWYENTFSTIHLSKNNNSSLIFLGIPENSREFPRILKKELNFIVLDCLSSGLSSLGIYREKLPQFNYHSK